MSDEQNQDEVCIPESEESAVRMVKENMDDNGDLNDQKRNLIFVQYRLIE